MCPNGSPLRVLLLKTGGEVQLSSKVTMLKEPFPNLFLEVAVGKGSVLQTAFLFFYCVCELVIPPRLLMGWGPWWRPTSGTSTPHTKPSCMLAPAGASLKCPLWLFCKSRTWVLIISLIIN